MKKIFVLLCLMLIPVVCFAASKSKKTQVSKTSQDAGIDPHAVKSADIFLKGIKLIDLPEGKKMISEAVWHSKQTYPVYTESSTLFEGMFETGYPKIKGYKRLMEVKVVSKGATPLLKQYLLISYKDLTTSKWKIWYFNESVDVEYEAQAACKDVDTLTNDDRRINRKLQKKYLRCGHWSTTAGKFIQAKSAYMKASELNQQETDDRVPQNIFDKDLIVLKKILGE